MKFYGQALAIDPRMCDTGGCVCHGKKQDGFAPAVFTDPKRRAMMQDGLRKAGCRRERLWPKVLRSL